MRTAAISGGLGDAIYSLPVLHQLGVKQLYVKQVALEDGGDTYTALRDLIELQGIQCLPTLGGMPFGVYEHALEFDYDMDAARQQPARGSNHIIRSFMAQFNAFRADWREPWLKIDHRSSLCAFKDYSVIAVTGRWRDNSKVDWGKIFPTISHLTVFLGFPNDYDAFWEPIKKKCPYMPVFIPTPTLLDAARIIRDAKAVYCNQNSLLTIAQGLGKEYWLEQKPRRTNVLLGTKNEHILI